MLTSPPGARLGVPLYILGIFLFSLNDALGKWIVADYGVGQLMAIRSVGAGLVLAPMLIRSGASLLEARQAPLQLLRVVCMAADTFSFFYAVRAMPLADALTFYMASPLIVTALSAPLLGERVERFRWIAVGVGFLGVLIALRPGEQAASWGALIALFGATMFALGQTLTRKLRAAHWGPLVAAQFWGAGLLGLTTLPWTWRAPGAFDLGLMFLTGAVAMAAFICITRALAMTRTAVLAPLQYSMIVWATLLGWAIWRDTPTLPILVGNAIIIGSGLYARFGRRGG